MFKSPFSFEGRIRRLEYGLSYLVYTFLYITMAFVWQAFSKFGIFFYLFYVAIIWFRLAQGAKRCHDLGNNAYFQFIPLYNLWLVFQEGDSGANKYGPCTKEVVEAEQTAFYPLPPQTNFKDLVLRLSSVVLLNVLGAALLLEYVPASHSMLFLYLLFTIIPGYFLALCFRNQRFQDHASPEFHEEQRVVYACLTYVCIRLYSLYFWEAEILAQFVFYELLVIAFIIGATYFPYLIYKKMFEEKIVQDDA